MKIFRKSVTKIVLLEVITALIAIELYKTYKWMDLDQVFIDVLIAITSFYFWQKGIKYDNVDSIDEEVLTNNNNTNGPII